MEKKERILEFIQKLKKDNFNSVDEWETRRFKIVCQDCNSSDVIMFFREESGRMGSEYTGYMRAYNNDNGIVVKCKNCGLAMDITPRD